MKLKLVICALAVASLSGCYVAPYPAPVARGGAVYVEQPTYYYPQQRYRTYATPGYYYPAPAYYYGRPDHPHRRRH